MSQPAQRYVSVDNAERLSRFWRMVDERFKPADEAVAIFKAVYLRDGADAAVEVAKLVIGAAAVLIAHEHGPDEARRILSAAIGAAQGQVS
jgi:hypothetical protein